MAKLHVGYVNVFVRDFDRAVRFFQSSLNLELLMREDQFGYASFQAGAISFGVAQTDDAGLVGRHTGIGFIVEDIDATYQELLARGVAFDSPPTRQPWGGILAMLKDPDGNLYYLDPGHQ